MKSRIFNPTAGHPRGLFGGVLLLVLLLLPLAGCDQQDEEKASIPSFTLQAVRNAGTISDGDFQGQALLINFFATWCPPCREEAPVLAALQDKYGDDDFTVLGISVDQGGIQTVRDFLAEVGINYPVVMSAADTPKSFGGVVGVPTSFLVDSQGQIIKRYEGYVEQRVLERELQKIL
ncbi:MAG: TlpA disulfide reductase family protein [Desulfurivibrio sp.]|nr:TlpA disulfide reductase family protein [Desulfurivibrio sp.]